MNIDPERNRMGVNILDLSLSLSLSLLIEFSLSWIR